MYFLPFLLLISSFNSQWSGRIECVISFPVFVTNSFVSLYVIDPVVLIGRKAKMQSKAYGYRKNEELGYQHNLSSFPIPTVSTLTEIISK